MCINILIGGVIIGGSSFLSEKTGVSVLGTKEIKEKLNRIQAHKSMKELIQASL